MENLPYLDLRSPYLIWPLLSLSAFYLFISYARGRFHKRDLDLAKFLVLAGSVTYMDFTKGDLAKS